MKLTGALFLLMTAAGLGAVPVVHADIVRISSPDHGQTFAYGSVKSRAFMTVGKDQQLALALHLTNDPYVDNDNFRQYDDFVFSFPTVKMGQDGHTFFYRSAEGESVPVAVKRPGFLGIPQIRLLPNVTLDIQRFTAV